MSQKGDLKGADELDLKMQERLSKQAESAATIVNKRNSQNLDKEAGTEESQKLSRVDEARKSLKGVENGKREALQVKFWCIIHLTNGEAYLHNSFWKLNDIPSVAEMMDEKAVLGEYNPATVVRIQIFKTQEEAEKAAKAIQNARDEKEKRNAKYTAEALAGLIDQTKK